MHQNAPFRHSTPQDHISGYGPDRYRQMKCIIISFWWRTSGKCVHFVTPVSRAHLWQCFTVYWWHWTWEVAGQTTCRVMAAVGYTVVNNVYVRYQTVCSLVSVNLVKHRYCFEAGLWHTSQSPWYLLPVLGHLLFGVRNKCVCVWWNCSSVPVAMTTGINLPATLITQRIS